MIKNWILQTFFAEYLREVGDRAKKLGSIDAFQKAHADIRETMADDLDKRAEIIAQQKLNDLLSPVDLTRIVSFDKRIGAIYIGGQRADDGQLGNLKAEAEFFLGSNLWKLLNETPKELAQKAMFVAGEGLDDMKKGRSILYTLSAQRNIVDTLNAYKPKPLASDKPSMV